MCSTKERRHPSTIYYQRYKRISRVLRHYETRAQSYPEIRQWRWLRWQCAQTSFNIYYNAINGRPVSRVARFGLIYCHHLPCLFWQRYGRDAGWPQSLGATVGRHFSGARRWPSRTNCGHQIRRQIDHIKTGGTLLNQKFTPQLLADDDGITKVANLVRTYFKMDGHHIQFTSSMPKPCARRNSIRNSIAIWLCASPGIATILWI